VKRLPKGLVCIGFDEEAFSACPVSHLAGRGHTTVGYVGALSPVSGHDWERSRLETLRRSAARSEARIKFVHIDEARALLLDRPQPSLVEYVSELRRSGRPAARTTLDYLFANRGRASTPLTDEPDACLASIIRRWAKPDGTLSQTPLEQLDILVFFLLHPEITSLVVSNDARVRGVHRRLRSIGIHIPGDLSLVSFDNYRDAVALPVDTVDNGAGELGYRAFHLILGDIPVAGRKRRDIVAQPFVVDRGSVGVGRKGQ
jgi:DNA-binding LacI/PurR family transcriptional regulator